MSVSAILQGDPRKRNPQIFQLYYKVTQENVTHKNGHNTSSQPFSSCCICVNYGFPNFWSNYIWHVDFSWNKVVRVDSTGPTNGTRSEKVWEPLL